MASLGLFLKLYVAFVDSPGQQVADQDVSIEVFAISSEFQHHVLAPLQVLYDGGGGIVAIIVFQERVPSEACQPVVQGSQRCPVDAQFIGQFAKVLSLLLEELTHPVPAEPLLKVKRCRSGYVGQVQVFLEQFDVFGFDFTISDSDDLVGGGAPAPGTLLVQCKGGNLGREQLLETFYLQIVVRILAAPPVLAVHVEYQGRCFAALQNAHQKEPSQESLPGSALAEYAYGSLHQLIQVQADLGIHVQWVTNPEMTVVVLAED